MSRDKTIEDHLPMVYACAKKILSRIPPHSLVDEDELVSEGSVALIRAYDRYDDSRGVTFGVYAKRRVYGSMLDFLRKIDHLPKGKRRLHKELKRLIGELEHELGRAVTDDELDEMGADVQLRLSTVPSQVGDDVECSRQPGLDEPEEYVRMMVQWEVRKWAQCAIAWYFGDHMSVSDIRAQLNVSERDIREAIQLAQKRLYDELITSPGIGEYRRTDYVD